MAFKRYINKNGKTLGPYYYKNIRQDGKVKTVYLGQKPQSNKLFPLFIVVIFLILLLGLSLFFSRQDLAMPAKTAEKSFEVDQQLIKVLLKEGESVTKPIRVMNTGPDSTFKISTSGLGDLIKISNKEFSLKPGQTLIADLKFLTELPDKKTYYNPDVYVGKITVQADGQQTDIPVIIEVESKQVLFDMNLNIAATQRQVLQGQVTTADISLFNLQQISPANVRMEYSLKDLSGNIILTESETVVLETKVSFSKTFKIPENLATGTYVFLTKALYGNSVGTSTYTFDVVKPEKEKAKELDLQAICSTDDPLCTLSLIILLLVMFFIGAYAYFFIGAYVFKKVSSGILEPAAGELEAAPTRKWPYYTIMAIIAVLILTVLHRRGILATLIQKTRLVWHTLPPIATDFVLVALAALVLILIAHFFLKNAVPISNAVVKIKCKIVEVNKQKRQEQAEKQKEAKQVEALAAKRSKAIHKIFTALNPFPSIKNKAKELRKKLTINKPIPAKLHVPKPEKKKPLLKLPRFKLPRLSLPKTSLPTFGVGKKWKQWQKARKERKAELIRARKQQELLKNQKEAEKERQAAIQKEKEQRLKLLRKKQRKEKIRRMISKIRLPRFKLPKFRLPKVSLPKFKLPKLSLPKFKIPKIKPSKQLPANIYVPKPEQKKPLLKLPKFKLPKVSLPKLPKVSLPRIPDFGVGRRWRQWQRAMKERKAELARARKQQEFLKKQKEAEKAKQAEIQEEKEQKLKLLKQQQRKEKIRRLISKVNPSRIKEHLTQSYKSTLRTLKDKTKSLKLPKLKQQPTPVKLYVPKPEEKKSLLPKFKLPRLSLPSVHLPRFKLPKLHLPKLRLLKFKLPEMHLPKFKLPKLTLPKMKPSKPVPKEVEKEVIKQIKIQQRVPQSPRPELPKPQVLKQIKESSAIIWKSSKDLLSSIKQKAIEKSKAKKPEFRPVKEHAPKILKINFKEKLSNLLQKPKELYSKSAYKLKTLRSAMKTAAEKIKKPKPRPEPKPEPLPLEPKLPEQEKEPLIKTTFKILHGLGIIKTKEERERLAQMKARIKLENEKNKQTMKLIKQMLQETKDMVERGQFKEAEYNYGLLVDAFRTLPINLQIDLRPEITKGYNKILEIREKLLRKQQ